MKNRFFLKLFTISVCLVSIYTDFVQGQAETIVFRHADGVYIRWQGASGKDFDGYHIYRSDNQGEWLRINETMLTIAMSEQEIIHRAGRFYGGLFLSLFSDSPQDRGISPQEKRALLMDPDAYSFLALMSVTQYPVGKLMGEVFLDTTINSHIPSVQYRITIVQDQSESEHAVTELFQPFESDHVPQPDSLWAEPMDRAVDLYWYRNPEKLKSGQITAFNVYRSESIIGPWTRINAAHILPVHMRSAATEKQPNGHLQSYHDRFLQNQSPYYYHITAVNSFGIESAPSPVIKVVPGDQGQPRPPHDLGVQEFGGSLKLNWAYNDRDEVKGFKIFRATEQRDTFEIIFPFSNLQLQSEMREYLDLETRAGIHYYYFLKAVGKNDLISSASDTISFYYPDRLPPLPPQNVRVEADSLSIKIHWSPNSEPDLLGYEVERASDEDLRSRFLVTQEVLTDTVFIDSFSVNMSTTLGYKVYALDRSMNRSRPSEQVTARLVDVSPPSMPVIYELTQSEGDVWLRWSQIPEPDLHSYRIYRADNDSTRLSFYTGRFENILHERNLPQGTYYYSVAAVDSSGNESPRTPLVWIEIRQAAPLPPANASVLIDDNGLVNIIWEPSPSPNVQGYIIQREGREDGRAIDLAQLPLETKEFTDRFAPSDQKFFYKIFTYDAQWKVSQPLIIEINE